ncbi:phospholipid/cholesterol/gamma-HCH transport system permease protein [Chitinophaga dinghuensis]|uniref:Phospholipid/cholesterol/gamma-HCH transport system permease protein n=1 Tax=Chitinophaga dinghuensis TaxID=1539050 RepID=A0A327VQP6_9BACT|nr:ABC transporter permease [Chitinophaga dinghuensis]RAJ77511.1 phospholipid/cholesterol/gamma-HCH transport system permease protein [Chitinophaga dinghuensis]
MDSSSGQPEKPVVSRGLDNFFLDLYSIFQFIKRFFKEALRPPLEVREFIRQCYMVGYKSLALITMTGFITGLVFTKQSRPSLSEFGATSWLPSLIAIAVVRALAPLVTSLICAGKVGSSIGAELASMKVTEQIDAMEVSAINPFKYLVVTRVMATTVCIPILVCYTGLVAMLGSFLDIYMNEHTSFTTFFQNAFKNITFLDFGTTTMKGIIYGFTIGIVGCYQGWRASQGTQGVGKAANVSVVVSMFLIFLEEVVIVQVANSFR